MTENQNSKLKKVQSEGILENLNFYIVSNLGIRV